MANPFVHVELSTSDVGKAKEFYSSLFDWKLTDAPMGGGFVYTMIDVGEGTAGGMMASPAPGMPPAWLAYVLVDDIAASTDKARSLGATIIKDNEAAGDFGRFSIIADPQGAVFALWMPIKSE